MARCSVQLAAATHPSGNSVGRQGGLARLDGYLQAAFSGRRQVVFVTGEAGIGKTSLVDVFQQQAIRHPDLRMPEGSALRVSGE
jgi:hypothetical protein